MTNAQAIREAGRLRLVLEFEPGSITAYKRGQRWCGPDDVGGYHSGQLAFHIPQDRDLLIVECEVLGAQGLPSKWFDAGRDVYLTDDAPLYGWNRRNGAWGYLAYRETSLVLTIRNDLDTEVRAKVTLRGLPVGIDPNRLSSYTRNYT